VVDEKTVIIKLRPDALLGGDARSPASEDPSRSPIELTAATFLRFSTPGRAFHNANRRLPLSGAECSSSLEETAISPALTPVGASRRNGPVWGGVPTGTSALPQRGIPMLSAHDVAASIKLEEKSRPRHLTSNGGRPKIRTGLRPLTPAAEQIWRVCPDRARDRADYNRAQRAVVQHDARYPVPDAVADLNDDKAGKRADGRHRCASPDRSMRHADGSERPDFVALLRGRSLCLPGREFVWSDGAAIA